MTLPFAPLPISEHRLIDNTQGALVGEWGTTCCKNYALFPDGRAMARIADNSFWTWASIVRLYVSSPHYMKDTDRTICRIIYTRTHWFDPFKKSCEPVLTFSGQEQLNDAFADGHSRFVAIAQYTKALYENYRTFGLVE